MKQTITLTCGELKWILKEVILEESTKQKTISDDVKNFNDVIRKTNNVLNENSINRMMQWLASRDCAFITAFRNSLKDIRDKNATYLGPDKDWEAGKVFTHEENREKNRLMVAQLLVRGYGVTKIKDVYPEGLTNENSEESYLVVNRHNDDNFLDNLLRIAEFYNQDSIYYKERGASKGYLIGANNNNDNDDDNDDEGGEGELKIGTASHYMSRLGNKAFSFLNQYCENVGNRAEAMDSIEKSIGGDNEGAQIYWTDNAGTAFHQRKEYQKQQMMEFVNFWRSFTEGCMEIKEDMHPLSRLCMSQTLSKLRNNS